MIDLGQQLQALYSLGYGWQDMAVKAGIEPARAHRMWSMIHAMRCAEDHVCAHPACGYPLAWKNETGVCAKHAGTRWDNREEINA